MFLLVPAYPGCPGSKAVKRSLLLLFLLANTTSEALQSSDIDLAAASVAIENLSNAVNKMRNTDSEFDRVYGSAREQ